MLSSRAPLPMIDPAYGLDLEGEIAVVLGDTPIGLQASHAHAHVRLLMLVNDITLRNLIPAELEKGFGFFCSKPASAFAPLAITPDELGEAWRDGRLHLPLRCSLNGALLGDPDASAMHFSFYDLMAHIGKTRAFGAGTILGGGTVSNEDPQRGVACLAERRTRETLEHGAPRTPFLQSGDRGTSHCFTLWHEPFVPRARVRPIDCIVLAIERVVARADRPRLQEYRVEYAPGPSRLLRARSTSDYVL